MNWRTHTLVILAALMVLTTASAHAGQRDVRVYCKSDVGVDLEVGRFTETGIPDTSFFKGPQAIHPHVIVRAEDIGASGLSKASQKKIRDMLRNKDACACSFLRDSSICSGEVPLECDTDEACQRIEEMSLAIASPGPNWKKIKKSLVSQSQQLQNQDMACVYDGVGMGPDVADALQQIRKNVRNLKTDGLTPNKSDCRVGNPSKQTQQRCADYQALQAVAAALGKLGAELDCPVEGSPSAADDGDKELCPGMGTVKEFKKRIADAADKIASGGGATTDPKTRKRLEDIADAISEIGLGDSFSNTIKWCEYAKRLLDAIDKVNAACTGAELGAAMDDLSAVSGQICAEIVDFPIAKDYCELIGSNERFFEAFDEVADPQKRNKQWEHIDEKFKDNYEYCRDR